MIENLKKDCTKRFFSHGYPSRKEENWKFTSSRSLAKFENDVSQKPKINHLDIDNNTILFVNGILDQRTLKNFKYNEKLKVVDLGILKEKSTLKISENFIKAVSYTHLTLPTIE